MPNAFFVFLLLFMPVVLVTSFVYVSKRHYERARIPKKIRYHIRRK